MSKKLLTLLLVLCMVISCIAPAASAVSPASETTASTAEETREGTVIRRNENAATVEGATVATGSEAIRDITADAAAITTEPTVNAVAETGNDGDGQWSFTEIDEADVPETVSGLLKENNETDNVKELDSLAEVYGASDVVTAFVVLEDEPLAAVYSSPAQIPDNTADTFAQKQEAVLNAIREDVDSTVEVVRQYSFLINSIVVSTEYQNLRTIAQMDGVASVFISPTFYPATTTDADKMTVSSGEMTNVDDVWNLNNSGYTGAGMLIAILDTGLDTDHPSFAADPELTEDSWTKESLQDLIGENFAYLNAAERNEKLSAEYVYYNAKVPFTFNYALGTNNVTHNDTIGDHGTHVAGIAAANEVEGTGVVGMAPDAQLVIMKVFNSTTGGASLYDFVDALEDCITLGVDVANLSLGSAAGFTESGYEAVDEIFNNIEKSGLVVNIAAGNEGTSASGSLYGESKALTSSIDNATVASPSTYANVMSIASVDNDYIMSDYFSVGETKVFYQPSVEVLYSYTDITMAETLSGQTLEYVIIDGLGAEEDFYGADGSSLVDGKVAVIQRGTYTFSAKVANAEAAGAVAALIWNNVSEDIYTFGMTTENDDGSYPGIPAVLIRLEDGEIMAEAENKTLTVAVSPALRINSTGGQISSFSSWGVAPDLRLLPDLSGIGGNVYSCYDGGVYGLMSGTSMATPQVTGVTALVQQYLKSIDQYDREVVENLMMSTANVITDSESKVETSPRQQGAGLVDALKAVTAEAYLTVNGGRPKAELGDSADGTYSFTFEITNFGSEAQTYTLSGSVLCEDYVTDGTYEYMAGYDRALDAAVTFNSGSGNTVTVPSGSTVRVSVSIALTESDKTWIQAHFENGNYVEGYIYLTNTAEEGGVDLNLPFLGFYGHWTDAPVFDSGYWYSDSFWAASVDGITSKLDAEEYWHVLWTSMGTSENDWILGLNPYSGVLADTDGTAFYSSDNNVVTPDGDGMMDQISDYYLSLLRNARYVWLTYTDESGHVLDKQQIEYLNKTMYNSNYGSTIPYVYSWYETAELYDFTDDDGNYLPDGTKLTLTISASLDCHDGEEVIDDSIEIPVTIDVSKPVLKSVQESYNGTNRYLIVTFDEAHPATVALMNPAGTQLYDQVYDNTLVKNTDGTYTAMVDITGYGDNFMLVLGDYGYQESHYQISRTEAGGNDPVLENVGLYAYQIYDLGIYYVYGWDYMFGWTNIDPATGAVEMINSDAYEYYALNAAEYVDGYVFAVDAGNNFLYMQPGLWNRNTICNIGYNVVDMAFDDTTGTMYLAISDDDTYTYGLAKLDLMTGEVTVLRNYYSKYSMPWSMTFVDGQLYCCKYYYNGFYEVDFTNNYAINPIKGEDGTEFKPVTSYGSSVSPYYSQTMTYTDGKIYWLYCSSSSTTELITIDPETWTNTAIALGATEYVGALTLNDTQYEIPESTEVTRLVLSQDDALIAVGEELALTANALPWNAPAGTITWTTSDNAIVSVSADGTITGNAVGTATVTASCNGVTAECIVRVISLGSDVFAYDYSGDGTYGYWQKIDLATMKTTNLYHTDEEYLAADYNGHDGYIYGVDSNEGYAWKMDPATGEAEKLGYSGYLADMSYDYTTGIMFAITGQDTYLYALNMHTGKLVQVANTYDYLATLACDMSGNLFSITLNGDLLMLNLTENGGSDDSGDDGIGGWEPLGGWDALYAALDADPQLDDGGIDDNFGVEGEGEDGSLMGVEITWIDTVASDGLYYGQCMCYDYINDVLLWCYTDGETFCQIGLDTDEWGSLCLDYVYNLGSTAGHSLPQYFGMYVVPEWIPELQEVPMTDVVIDPMFLLVGATAAPEMTISPVNTNLEYDFYYEVAWSYTGNYVDDDTVITLNDDGTITANKAGTAYVDAYVFDKGADPDAEDAEPVFYTTFQVTVKNATDSRILSYFGDSYCWADMDQYDPADPEFGSYVLYDGNFYFMYSAEYVNETGLIYGYGFDVNAWDANFTFFTFDPKTLNVQSAKDMGNEFPFVYDMAYDYTTGTMYALAGTTDVVSLYYVDLTTGELVLACTLDGNMYLNMAVDAEGTVYIMSKTAYSYVDWDTVQIPAVLYRVDVASGTITEVLNTGVDSSYIGSLSYDYNTGYFYWTPYLGMYLIDLTDYSVNRLGDTAGQFTGLVLCANDEDYPEPLEELVNVILTTTVAQMNTGDELALTYFVQPSSLDVTTSWNSDDENVATVDENGVITAVGAGTATITLTVTNPATGESLSATCTVIVYGEGDYFLSYNETDNGFSAINRVNPSTVTNLTENEEASPVQAMFTVDDVIYAYDEDGNLFTTTVEDGFARTYIGNHGIDVSDLDADTSEDWGGGMVKYDHYKARFVVQDMTMYNGRALVLGVTALDVNCEVYNNNELSYTYDWHTEIDGGCKLYEADLTTGELTELCTITTEFGSDDNMVGAKMLEAAGDTLYVYNTYNDHINVLNAEDGTSYRVASLQGLGVTGDENSRMAMTYDESTNNMILLFTSNGSKYRLFKMNLDTAALNEIGMVGGEPYDLFRGLTVVSGKEISGGEHTHDWVEVDRKDPTCVENGYIRYECSCGGEYEKVLPLTGKHEYAYNTKGELVCVHCGKVQSTTLPTVPTTPGASGTSTSVLPFSDVAKTDWYYSAVSYVYGKGLMNGTSDTTFDPNGSVTRAMVVQTLYRLAGSPSVSGTNSFTDLTQDWYKDAIQWAYENGITTGRSDTIFDPNASVTREELAAFIYRYAAYCGYSVKAAADLSGYTDLSALSDWAETSMSWANAKELVNGRTETTLAPKGTATRAELATILMRFCENIVG